MEERLQKLISSCGLASRRTAEAWISQGRVTVNGSRAALGDRADLERDRVADGGLSGVRLRPEGVAGGAAGSGLRGASAVYR